MDLTQFSHFFSGQSITNLFFKAFALFFAFFYLFYTVIIFRQTSVMNKTVQGEGSTFITLISFIQIIFALILIALALFLV